ncbi:MAG: hypothetical protein KDJ27_19675, partial [Gammaproteobacteria bacterium]|nr:hypothetical protein [Gammaproteobacteria bacterium]
MDGKQLALDLSKIALAGLAANAGLIGPVANAGGAMLGAGLSQWLDRVLGNWREYTSYLNAAQTQLLARIEGQSDGQQALATALIAARNGAITARRYAQLGFDPEQAAAEVSTRLGYYNLQTEAGELDEAPLARQLLVDVYACFLQFKDSRDELNVSFQQETLTLLQQLTTQMGALHEAMRSVAEAHAWTGLLRIPTSTPRKSQSAPARLLTAGYELLPYHPREQDAELRAWLDSDEPIAIRTITAGGGVGKTRWLLQHCQDRVDLGWRAGFLTDRDPDPDAYCGLFRSADRILVVFDYVEGRRKQLAQLLNEADARVSQSRRIRIVGLARNLDSQWWDGLRTERGLQRDTARDLIDDDSEWLTKLDLQALLPDSHDRQAVFDGASGRLGEYLGAERATGTMPDLSAKMYQDPLFIQLAALNRLLGGSPALDAPRLLDKVLDHEARYWQMLGGYARETVEPLLALATLWQGIPAGEGSPTIERWPNADSPLRAVVAPELVNALRAIYPTDDGGIAPLQPDRLGEALVRRVLDGAEKIPYFRQRSPPISRPLVCSAHSR